MTEEKRKTGKRKRRLPVGHANRYIMQIVVISIKIAVSLIFLLCAHTTNDTNSVFASILEKAFTELGQYWGLQNIK